MSKMLKRLFGSRKRTPQQRVDQVRENITTFLNAEKNEEERAEAQTLLHSNLEEIQRALYPDPESKSGSDTDAVRQELAENLISGNLMLVLVRNLPKLEFEDRKIVSAIFKHLVHNDVKNFGTEFIGRENLPVVDELIDMYGNTVVALLAGSMVRECIRVESVAEYLLRDGRSLRKMFEEFVHSTKFEVSSDVLATLRDLFTLHKAVVARFLNDQYDEFFAAYKQLLDSKNYVTRRQSLKLLGELLLDRENRSVMLKYIDDRHNLRTIMVMLSDPRPNIQFEAFHVFKVFVANPKKSAGVIKVLSANKARLVAYLQQFHNDRAGDDQFVDEKALLIKELAGLPDKPAPAPAPAAAVAAAPAPAPVAAPAPAAADGVAAGAAAAEPAVAVAAPGAGVADATVAADAGAGGGESAAAGAGVGAGAEASAAPVVAAPPAVVAAAMPADDAGGATPAAAAPVAAAVAEAAAASEPPAEAAPVAAAAATQA